MKNTHPSNSDPIFGSQNVKNMLCHHRWTSGPPSLGNLYLFLISPTQKSNFFRPRLFLSLVVDSTALPMKLLAAVGVEIDQRMLIRGRDAGVLLPHAEHRFHDTSARMKECSGVACSGRCSQWPRRIRSLAG